MLLRTLRGARIVQALLEQSSYDDLLNNITTAFPDTKKRQNATNEVTIAQTLLTPVRTTADGGAIRVNTITRSNGHQYSQVIMLMDVKFEPSDTETNATFDSTDGTEYHVAPIDTASARTRVNCNCLDFHHRFATWNFDDQSLMGKKPPPYQRKTDTRPPVNPSRVPGLCKHLVKVFSDLQSRGLIS